MVYKFLILAGFSVCLEAFAVAPSAAEDVIPSFTTIGHFPEAHLPQLARVRDTLVEMTRYWQQRGLTEASPLEAIFVIGDTRGMGAREFMAQVNPKFPNLARMLEDTHEILRTLNGRRRIPLTKRTWSVPRRWAERATEREFDAHARHLHLPVRNARAAFSQNGPIDGVMLTETHPLYGFTQVIDRRFVRLNQPDYVGRQIFIPRLPNQNDDPAEFETLSHLYDVPVLAHEVAHALLIDLGLKDLVLHEALADVMTAIATGVTNVEFRVRHNLRYLRERLKDHEYFTPPEAMVWSNAHVNPHRRELNTPRPTPPSRRYLNTGDAYDDSFPISNLLWRARAAVASEHRAAFDEATVRVVRRLVAWPAVSAVAQRRFAARATWNKRVEWLARGAVTLVHRTWTRRERRELHQRADQIFERWAQNPDEATPLWTRDQLRGQMRLSSGDTVADRPSRLFKQGQRTLARLIDQSPDSLRRVLNGGAEPATRADYMVPELVRAYDEHLAESPHRTEIMFELFGQSQILFDRHEVFVDLADGSRTVMLLPTQAPWLTRMGLGLAARGWMALKRGRGELEQMTDDDPRGAKLKARLDRLHFRLQEFERTGNPIHLVTARPHGWLRAAALAAVPAVMCARALGGL